MGSFDVLLTHVLGMHLRAKNYSKIWDVMIKDRSVFPALINAGTEAELIAFLDFYGPENADEEIEGTELSYACRDLLPLAYKKGWYKLCSFIYGMGYYSSVDSLCGGRHPLAFGAAEHNAAFVDAFIEGQKRFEYLAFDGERRCEDGIYRTLLEEIVFIDDVPTMQCCLKNGANANAFGFHGDRLLDIARSSEMHALLQKYGAVNATEHERNLVWIVNELRNECLKRATVNAFFSTSSPILKLTCYNGTTANSRKQTFDIFMEAALACHADLLGELYPYAKNDLDDMQRKEILRAILGQHYTLPCGRILDERPVDIARSLEFLCSAGFRYGADHLSNAEHPILGMIRCACWSFSFREQVSIKTQLRVFSALWKIGGSPRGDFIIQVLTNLAEEHPSTALEMFISRVRHADEEE